MKFEIHKEGKAPLIRVFSVLLIGNIASFLLFPNKLFTLLLLVISIVIFAITLNFYKQPNRTYEGDLHGLVNAPADGRIVAIEKVFENNFFHEERIQISIFMSLFNAHSNWAPVTGKITHYSHVGGNFHRAFLPKSSIENEHSNIVIETPNHGIILVKQIAGAMARRIVTYVKEGEELPIGSPLGFIKLGSRMDVFLPSNSKILVSMGEEVRANITFLAQLTEQTNK